MPVAGRFRVRASLATAFNAPAFNQLRATTYTAASPNLQPERTRSWEIGFEQSWTGPKLRVSGAYFNQRFSQLIQYVDGGPPAFLGSYANLTAASSNGYEGEAAMILPAAFWVSGSFSVVAPKVASVAPSYSGSLKPGDALIRRPSHSETLRVGHSMKHDATLDLSASYVGKRPDLDFAQFPSPTLTLPSYVRIDLSAQRPMFVLPNYDALSLTARVENVLGRKYQDVIGYPAPGRVILIGAALRSPYSR
jgi:vitamin B12 transporter